MGVKIGLSHTDWEYWGEHRN